MERAERRHQPRIEVGLPLKLTIRDATVETRIQNLSSSGIRFHTPEPLPLMSRVQIALELPESDAGGGTSHVAITGVVVRCDETDEAAVARFDTAIYFEDLSDSARSRLALFVKGQSD